MSASICASAGRPESCSQQPGRHCPSSLGSPGTFSSSHLESPGGRVLLLSTEGIKDATCPVERWGLLESGWVLWLLIHKNHGSDAEPVSRPRPCPHPLLVCWKTLWEPGSVLREVQVPGTASFSSHGQHSDQPPAVPKEEKCEGGCRGHSRAAHLPADAT